jgi:hypothetical protein
MIWSTINNYNNKTTYIQHTMNNYGITNGIDLRTIDYDVDIVNYPYIYKIYADIDYDPSHELISNTNIKCARIYNNGNILTSYVSPLAKLQSIGKIKNGDLIDGSLINLIWKNYYITNSVEGEFPPDAKYINIVYNEHNANCDHHTINFPLSTRTLKIEVGCSLRWLKQILILLSNLPFDLKKLIISFDNSRNVRGWGEYSDGGFKQTLKDKLKLPIGCELIIDPYVKMISC